MDHWIRYGLFATWVLFGGASLWWWRRRHSSRRYPYSERAVVILDALKKTADLGLIYWSKSEKKYLRRIVTPLELDGYSLKAFDHGINDVRIFKITRIRKATIVARGSRSLPSLITATMSTWAVGGCGAVAAALLGVALFRGHGPQTDLAVSVPLPPPVAQTPAVAPVTTESAELPPPAIDSASDIAETNTSIEAQEPAERWEVIVDDDPKYDAARAAKVIQVVLSCTQVEAEEFVRQVRSLGHASIWIGRWSKAERMRQVLEAEDLLAHLQRAETDLPAD